MWGLLEVDEVRVTIVMDNTVDVLTGDSDVARRFHPGPGRPIPPIAEHGFSALICARRGDKSGTVLLDTGASRECILHNTKALGIDMADIQALVLSHGHSDHTGGLPALLSQLGGGGITLVFHPDALLKRKVISPGGGERDISPPPIADLQGGNINMISTAGPTLLADNAILVSGEIARTTDFEKGFPNHCIERGGVWENDPLIRDDQCIVVNVRGQGLVIVTGCGHAGIINTIRHARALTGVQRVFAVIGGLHLSGGPFEKIIPETIAELKEIGPKYIMPGHCTGFSAIHQIARALPDAFIPSSAGTTLVLQGS
jgi:7,8-dihydropterin-6-yl-methyl-4-(beta-D-ribofuranosyl)aminobenzene 5'-phosphate synthase